MKVPLLSFRPFEVSFRAHIVNTLRQRSASSNHWNESDDSLIIERHRRNAMRVCRSYCISSSALTARLHWRERLTDLTVHLGGFAWFTFSQSHGIASLEAHLLSGIFWESQFVIHNLSVSNSIGYILHTPETYLNSSCNTNYNRW